MNKLLTFFLFICSFLLMHTDVVLAQKCRYDADMINPSTHARTRRVHVDLDKRWAVLFQQEDTVYSICLLIDAADTPVVKMEKGNMLHIELENGKRFDLFVAEDGKATTKEVGTGNRLVHEAKCIVDKRTLGLFAENALTGMKLHMKNTAQVFEEPDDRKKAQIMKAAQCMMKE